MKLTQSQQKLVLDYMEVAYGFAFKIVKKQRMFPDYFIRQNQDDLLSLCFVSLCKASLSWKDGKGTFKGYACRIMWREMYSFRERMFRDGKEKLISAESIVNKTDKSLLCILPDHRKQTDFVEINDEIQSLKRYSTDQELRIIRSIIEGDSFEKAGKKEGFGKTNARMLYARGLVSMRKRQRVTTEKALEEIKAGSK